MSLSVDPISCESSCSVLHGCCDVPTFQIDHFVAVGRFIAVTVGRLHEEVRQIHSISVCGGLLSGVFNRPNDQWRWRRRRWNWEVWCQGYSRFVSHHTPFGVLVNHPMSMQCGGWSNGEHRWYCYCHKPLVVILVWSGFERLAYQLSGWWRSLV